LFLQLDNLKRFQMVKQTRAPSAPTPEMMAALTQLCSDRRNTVFVVSGKERHSLTNTLSHIPHLGLAAEHGMFISWPSPKADGKRIWETIVPDRDRSWRNLAINIMEVYTSRTHGSYIEKTEMKVLWQYRDADPEFGYLQARELEDHLANVLKSYAVDILLGGVEEGGYVEVRPKGVNKGVLALHVIQKYPSISTSSKVDFALVLGDDHCDEPMLSVMRQVGRRIIGARRSKRGEDPLPPVPTTLTLVDVSACDPYVSPELEVFTCTVGKKPSAAANYLHDVAEVQELLDSLVKVSTRERKYNSAVDLRSYGADSGPEMMDSGASPSWLNSATLSPAATKAVTFTPEARSPNSTHAEIKVSSNLNEYLGLGTIEDDDDEEAFFF
jgi:trehalose 6-phosphate synthase/phosphatase